MLRRNPKRVPLSWWRFDDGTVRVVCSQGHASLLRHIVLEDGSLRAPAGQLSSCHCGHCNEDLPLKLEGWLSP
jgi:hypothetical protein